MSAIEWIEADTLNMSFEMFCQDRRTRQLVERNLEIISEASRRIPEAYKAMHPDIRWKEIAGIGNILRHDYHEVVPSMMWAIIKEELSFLKKAIQSMVQQLDSTKLS